MSDTFPLDFGGSVKNPFAPLFNFNVDVDNVFNDEDDFLNNDKIKNKGDKRRTRNR
jgi:hypothetical protein